MSSEACSESPTERVSVLGNRAAREKVGKAGQKGDIERNLNSLKDKIQGISLAVGTTVAGGVSIFYKAAFSALLAVIAINLGLVVFIAAEFRDVDSRFERLTSHFDDRFTRLETMSQSQPLKVFSLGGVSSEEPPDTAD